ncbi:hypothetical protein TELCIR_06248 [Teladorsagia circumcincta]|uniref:Histone acetyltransferase type B catalytic subunit n=1 Tax=Teladorsagia circumcincta TaxID=45464 RepID=A0A2G9UNW6_TELCI|nr:hypothetical protein TELCIR_06248 [Teladorsagia circumcincta]
MRSSALALVNAMVRMEQDNILTASANRFVTNALDAVRIRFGEKCYELYKISESSPEFDAYLTRVQSLALWKSGLGAKLLDAIYKDLCSMKEVLDVTAEDPADNFVYLRDYVDCVNCSKLPEFAPSKLKSGFTEDMRIAALNKLKITKRQSRRVYEILRLKCTNMKDAAEAKAYRLDVKRRLEAPMRRNERDWKKIQRALDDNEYAQVAASYVNADQKMQQLQQLYEEEVEAYKLTIQRMTVHPSI